MELNQSIVNSHLQLFDNSCVASSVELVLKLENFISPDSHPLQVDQQLGGENFDGRNFVDGSRIITFHQKDHRHYSALEGCLSLIRSEILDQRYVIVPLRTGSSVYHNHVVYDVDGDEFRTFTVLLGCGFRDVSDMMTRFSDNFMEMLHRPISERYGIDIITYTIS